MTSTEKFWLFIRSSFRYALGVVFWNITMFIVVLTLCFIALPKTYSEGLICWLDSNQCQNLAASIPNNKSQIPSTPQVATQSATSDVAVIARLTLDSSKERFEIIKEVQDRLFSLIAALAALLAFLGFKGVESYFTAREKAVQASIGVEKYKSFLEVQYPKNVQAEMAVVHGAALRDMADMHNDILAQLGSSAKSAAYIGCLKQAVEVLRTPAFNKKSNDDAITARALGTLGNIYHRLDRYEDALNCSVEILSFLPNDIDANFNAACYCVKIAESLKNQSRGKESRAKLQEALKYCERYKKIEESQTTAIDELKNEVDLNLLRVDMQADFDALLKEK